MLRYPVAASAARYPVPALLHRADGRRAGSRDLGQRQDQGLSALVLGRPAGAAGQGPLSERSGGYFEFIYPPLPAVLLAIPPGSARSRFISACRCLNVGRLVDDRAVLPRDGGIGPEARALAGSAARLRHHHLRVRHVRSRPAQSRAAGADALRLLAAARASAPGWRAACLRSPPPSRCFRSRCFPIWSGGGSGRRPRACWCFSVMFLFVLPAPFRGFQHNVAELKTWYQGMVGSSSEKGFGQRDEQNWSWVNQSIIAMTHRLTRPVNYTQDDPSSQAGALHERRRSRFQDGELDRACDIACARARLSRGDAAGLAADREVGRRRARHPVLPDDGGLAAGAAILFHVAVLPDDGADASRRL